MLLSLHLLSAVARPRTLSVASAARCTAVRRRTICATAAQQEFVPGLAFDLETTGLDTGSAEIVQLAIVVANSKHDAKFSRFVLPRGDIDPGAAAVHGITKDILVQRGAQPFDAVWEECEAWCTDTFGSDRPLVWAAHNGARFDEPILRRCVHEATGGPSALLSAPRASFVDTLKMARAGLPGRYAKHPYGVKPGPYTLGALYKDAHPDGASLENAHDALVDAQALARVWRWLVDEQSADKRSTQWEGGQLLGSAFQAHLQFHGYQLQPPPAAAAAASSSSGGRASARARAAHQENAKAASRAIRHRDDSGRTSSAGGGNCLTRVPGIGPTLAQKLSSKGITTYDELRDVWDGRGRNKKRMSGWLIKSIPGSNKMALAKAAKGMAEEWGEAEGV